MRLIGHVACMEEFRNSCRMPLGTLKGGGLSISGRIRVKWILKK
jgi:hypothetical protein